MFQDTGGLPIAGGALMAVVLYGGVSLFITGPVIAERTIEKSDWAARCDGFIRAEIKADEPEAPRIPKLGCSAIFGLYGRAGQEYCRVHGHHFDNNILPQTLEAAQKAKRAARKKRMDYAASRAGSRCDCAVTMTLEKRRTDFALYAGTLRLVVPRSVKALQSELTSALNSPECAAKGS